MTSPEVLHSISKFFGKILPKELRTTLSDFRLLILVNVGEKMLHNYTAKLNAPNADVQATTKRSEEYSGVIKQVIEYSRQKLEDEVATTPLPKYPDFMKAQPSYQEVSQLHNSMIALLEKGRKNGVWKYTLSEIDEDRYRKSDQGFHAELPSGVRIVFDATLNTYTCPHPSTYTFGNLSNQFTNDYKFLLG